MNVYNYIRIVSISVLLAGCGLFGEDEEFEIRTDESEYGPSATIQVRAKNRTSQAVFYNSCMPTVMQEIRDGRVVAEIHFPVCACLCITELSEGETWRWEINTEWLWQQAGPSQPKLDVDYRFAFEFYEDMQLQRQLEARQLITNRFRFKGGNEADRSGP